MTALVLPPHLRVQLEQEARVAFPAECCGLIEGVRLREGWEARMLHPTRNLAGAVDRFDIDPADHLRLQREARARRAAIIGCYHSHPEGTAEPSPRDLAGAREAGFLWLIAAVGAEPVRIAGFAFKLPGFQRIALV